MSLVHGSASKITITVDSVKFDLSKFSDRVTIFKAPELGKANYGFDVIVDGALDPVELFDFMMALETQKDRLVCTFAMDEGSVVWADSAYLKNFKIEAPVSDLVSFKLHLKSWKPSRVAT